MIRSLIGAFIGALLLFVHCLVADVSLVPVHSTGGSFNTLSHIVTVSVSSLGLSEVRVRSVYAVAKSV